MSSLDKLKQKDYREVNFKHLLSAGKEDLLETLVWFDDAPDEDKTRVLRAFYKSYVGHEADGFTARRKEIVLDELATMAIVLGVPYRNELLYMGWSETYLVEMLEYVFVGERDFDGSDDERYFEELLMAVPSDVYVLFMGLQNDDDAVEILAGLVKSGRYQQVESQFWRGINEACSQKVKDEMERLFTAKNLEWTPDGMVDEEI